ncbi:MAG: IS4 family transposase [Chloroflexi bacterium]|nr:IS4 family transposase [Chloroflexota bacterium]
MQEINWVIEETKTAHFSDERLKKRYINLLDGFTRSPDKSIPGTCKTWKETIAAYRFFNHEDITPREILTPHYEATLKRIKKEKVVLIPQDTTEIDFTGRKELEGMGYLGDERSQGFYLHPSLAITPEKLCLGLIDVQVWQREEFGSRAQRKDKPIKKKESYRWLKGYDAANRIALDAPDTTVVSISDREGDIYEVLAKMPSEENKAYWLIRSGVNRKTLEGDNLKLQEAVKISSSIGEIEFELPAGRVYNRDKSKRVQRKKRSVRQEVRVCTVKLCPPRRKDGELSAISINVIHCIEIDPPNEEDKIEWFLLTSLPVNNAEAAIDIVSWYLCRWQIEIFFKLLKSGCTVEKLQFESFKATSNCIALYMIVAWRILYLTTLGRVCPDIECSCVFELDEWQSVYAIATKKAPPKKPPKLNEIIIMLAKLGGFLGRKGDGFPGPKVMWIGIQRMKDFTLGWGAFRTMRENSYV